MRKFLLIFLLIMALGACRNGEEGGENGNGAAGGQDSAEITESVREATAVPPTATPLPTPRSLPEQKVPGHIYPVSTRTIHTVQYGDTLSKIAQQYDVSVKSISDANRIYNFDLIQVGDTLYIPSCDQ